MTAKTSKNVSDVRIHAAIAEIIAACSLKPTDGRQLFDFVQSLRGGLPKLPFVSLYPAKTRWGTLEYRLSYNVPGYKRRTERLGRVPKLAQARQRRVSEVLCQVDARLMRPEDAHRLLYVDSTSIDKHVATFKDFLSSRGSVPRYVEDSVKRLRRCIELAGYRRLDEIREATLPRLIDALQRFKTHQGKHLTTSTINDHLATLRQFTRWATPALIPIDPLLKTGNIRNNDAKKRRHVSVEELGVIVAVTRYRKARGFKLNGFDRAMLYLSAYGTGLRRSELLAVEVSWLRLTAAQPYIAVPGSVTKDGKDAKQPVPAWLVEELTSWLAGRQSGPLWEVALNTVGDMFEMDRAAAREAWVGAGETDADCAAREASPFLRRETVEGEIVFHSLRHAYATQLLSSNLDPKNVQQLTRHATLSVLPDTYSHALRGRATQGLEAAIVKPITESKAALAQGAAHSHGE